MRVQDPTEVQPRVPLQCPVRGLSPPPSRMCLTNTLLQYWGEAIRMSGVSLLIRQPLLAVPPPSEATWLCTVSKTNTTRIGTRYLQSPPRTARRWPRHERHACSHSTPAHGSRVEEPEQPRRQHPVRPRRAGTTLPAPTTRSTAATSTTPTTAPSPSPASPHFGRSQTYMVLDLRRRARACQAKSLAWVSECDCVPQHPSGDL